MKKVFTHENRLIVFHLKNLLEEQGITCRVKNEFASGGVGDLSPFETWPELWVDDDVAEWAAQVVGRHLQAEREGEPWRCKFCGEHNDSHFEVCWNCSQGREHSAG